MKCKVCGNEVSNIVHNVKERIINKGEEFQYLECGRCGSWTLINVVDLSCYYPKDYSPHTMNNSRTWKMKLLDFFIIRRLLHFFAVRYIVSREYSDFPRIFHWRFINPLFMRLCGSHISTASKILDVGCALGGWLNVMAEIGYKNLTGVDLFLPDNLLQTIRWRFVKGEIFDINDSSYDLITFNHSLEHMPEPVLALRKAKEILSQNGRIMVSIPLAGGRAHRQFGENFSQIDAPRHLYLYTHEGFSIACKEAGLEIEAVNYDSSGLIFSLSESLRDSMDAFDNLSKLPVPEKYNRMAEESNIAKDADRAIFFLKVLHA